MKSKIKDVVIIPTDLLLDRKLKYLVRGYGWRGSLESIDKAITAVYAVNIKAVLDPDYAFHGKVKYVTSEYIGRAQIELKLIHGYSRVRLVPLIIYKKDCYENNRIGVF